MSKQLLYNMNHGLSHGNRSSFQTESAFQIGKFCKKHCSSDLLSDFLFIYPKIISLYLDHEEKFDDIVRFCPLMLRIHKKRLDLVWHADRTPTLVLRPEEVQLHPAISRKWDYSIDKKRHGEEGGRNHTLGYIFVGYRRQVLAWETKVRQKEEINHPERLAA